MRLYDHIEVILSEDTLTEPKQIRFKQDEESIDVDSLSEARCVQETFPVGTNVVSMGNISSGKWLFIRPTDHSVGLVLNGSTALTIAADKSTKMWVTFTSISVVVSTQETEVLLTIAG